MQIKSTYNNYTIPKLGTNDNLEIMTWNMERFPPRRC